MWVRFWLCLEGASCVGLHGVVSVGIACFGGTQWRGGVVRFHNSLCGAELHVSALSCTSVPLTIYVVRKALDLDIQSRELDVSDIDEV